MPNPRFWEMEERQVNFGALDAQTTDQLLLVFAELGLVYGNDWFVVPYEVPVNTLCEVWVSSSPTSSASAPSSARPTKARATTGSDGACST